MLRQPLSCLPALLTATLLLGGCSAWKTSTDPFVDLITPYRMDIQQGNVVTSEQLARVKVGMNKLQVRDALGTPLLADPFHAERWDYVFFLKVPHRPLQRHDLTLIFDLDRLTKIDAPELPTEEEFVASVAKGIAPALARSLELSEAQMKALPPPPSGAASAAAADSQTAPQPAAPPRKYPPLEPS